MPVPADNRRHARCSFVFITHLLTHCTPGPGLLLSLIQVFCHFFGGIYVAWMIVNDWHYQYMWYIVALTNVPTFIMEFWQSTSCISFWEDCGRIKVLSASERAYKPATDIRSLYFPVLVQLTLTKRLFAYEQCSWSLS